MYTCQLKPFSGYRHRGWRNFQVAAKSDLDENRKLVHSRLLFVNEFSVVREIVTHVRLQIRVCSSVGTERQNVCASMFVLCVVECCVCEAECVWHGARPPCEQQLFVDTGSVLGCWGVGGLGERRETSG